MNDIILYICRYLNNRQKINFLSTTTITHQLKSKTYFKKRVVLGKIMGLFYFDQFENIFIDNKFERLPSNTKMIQFDKFYKFSIESLKDSIKITHVILGDYFLEKIDWLPSTIKFLSIGNIFRRSIKHTIPDSVTHLQLKNVLHESIEQYIPNTVIYLTIDRCRYKYITLPPNLLYLKMSCYWDALPIISLPNTLTHLRIFYRDCDTFSIPSSVICLQLRLIRRSYFPTIPFGVERLIICSQGSMPPLVNLPESIKYLQIRTCTGQINLLNAIPFSVKRLDLDSYDYENINKCRPGLKIKKIK
jgi:hypothetical protein